MKLTDISSVLAQSMCTHTSRCVNGISSDNSAHGLSVRLSVTESKWSPHSGAIVYSLSLSIFTRIFYVALDANAPASVEADILRCELVIVLAVGFQSSLCDRLP